jgi:hypothetical protein
MPLILFYTFHYRTSDAMVDSRIPYYTSIGDRLVAYGPHGCTRSWCAPSIWRDQSPPILGGALAEHVHRPPLSLHPLCFICQPAHHKWTHRTRIRCGWVYPWWHRTCSTWRRLTRKMHARSPPLLIAPEVSHHRAVHYICCPYPWRRRLLRCWLLATIPQFGDTYAALVHLPKPWTSSDSPGWSGCRRREWNTPSLSSCCTDACYEDPREVPARIRWPWWRSWTKPPREDGPKRPPHSSSHAPFCWNVIMWMEAVGDGVNVGMLIEGDAHRGVKYI